MKGSLASDNALGRIGLGNQDKLYQLTWAPPPPEVWVGAASWVLWWHSVWNIA